MEPEDELITIDETPEPETPLPEMKNYKNFWTVNAANLAMTMMGARTRRAPVVIILDGDWICDFAGVPCDVYYGDFDEQQRARTKAGEAAFDEIGLRIEPALDFGVVLDASIYGGAVKCAPNAPPTIEPVLESPEGVAALAARMDAADPLSLGLVPRMLEWRGRLKAESGKTHFAGVTTKGPGSMCGQICGMTNFLMWLAANPAEMKALIDLQVRTTIRYIRAMRRATGARVPYLALADDLSGMVSEKMYREFFYPAHKKIFEELAPWPQLRYFHNDARAGHILHHVRKLRPGAVNFDAKVTVRQIRERIPDAVIFGHIPPIEVLLNGTPEQVRQTALANVAHARADRGRIVLTTAGSINPGTPFDNLRALIQASRESQRLS